MKFTKIFICLVIAVAVTGCNVLKMGSTKKGQVVADTTNVVKKENVANVALFEPERQLAGEWTLVEVHNKKVKTTEHPFITFDFSQNRFYGNNGCNVINGSFAFNGNAVKFSDIISTLRTCDNATSERDVMKVFYDAVSVELYEKKSIRYMRLLSRKGHVLATFKEQNLAFMNGAWTVDEISGTTVTDKNVKLVIDLDQLTLHGNSGCNIVNGTVYIDYDKDWGVQFQGLVSSMKMCENIKTETALLVALEMTETCKKIDDTKIAMYDGKGKCVVKLKRLHLEK